MFRYKCFVHGRFFTEIRANSPRLAAALCVKIYGVQPTYMKYIGGK